MRRFEIEKSTSAATRIIYCSISWCLRAGIREALISGAKLLRSKRPVNGACLTCSTEEGTTMAVNSSIEWTDATWNPVRGCTKVSPGCTHCYAETFAERYRGVKGPPFEHGFDLRLVR